MGPDELKKLVASMKEEAEIRQRINESSAEYLKLLKDIKNLNKDIADSQAALIEQLGKERKARAATIGLQGKALIDAQAILDIEEQKSKILRGQLSDLKESAAQMTKIAKEAGKLTKSFAAFSQVKKDVGAITSTVSKGYGILKGWAGLFEMDKKIRMSALSMGLLDTQTKSFRDNLFYASQTTQQFGLDIGELAELQAKFSDELGRTVMLSQEGLISMGAMAKATGLGSEGAAQLAGDFDRIGISAEGTANFMEQTMNDASKMGLNASKVVRNIQQNMKMLNKYNFKGGVNGLKKMAESMTKMGLDMNMVAPMADKLFDIEGAVDMSAQLQVLGGEWSKLADPFHLMYMARNDMEGLTKDVVNATAASSHWSKTNKQFEISALEMHTLRKVAEQTGMSYEDLAASAKKAAQFVGVRKQISYGFDEDTKKFIETTADIDDNGNATITINGNKKLVSQLTNMDKTALDTMIAEKKTLKERADAAQTFDEKLTNLINQVKTLLLPVLEGLDTTLRPIIKKFSEAIADPKFLETIKGLGESIGKIIGSIGKFIFENPKWSLALFGVFEAAKWILNGVALGIGFNKTASIGGGGGGGGLGTRNMAAMSRMGLSTMGKFGANFKGAAGSGAAIGGGILAGGLSAYNEYGEQRDKGKSVGSSLGRAGLKGLGAGGGAWAGAAAGAALGAFGGPLAPITVPLGALIGGGLGAWGGGELTDLDTYGIDDGVMFNPRDKFLKLNDGAMIAGTNENGNQSLADAMMKSKDYNGSKSNNSNTISRVEFGELSINGKLMIESPGNPNMSVDLLKNPEFISEITKKMLVQIDVSKRQVQKG
jgi:hypothetical protein